MMEPTIEQVNTHTFRAGDIVQHAPSGEEWILASVSTSGEWVYPAGWPESTAPASQLTLVKAATDEEHVAFLLKVVEHGVSGPRAAKAFDNLLALHSDSVKATYDQLRQAHADAQHAAELARQQWANFEEGIRNGVLLPKPAPTDQRIAEMILGALTMPPDDEEA